MFERQSGSAGAGRERAWQAIELAVECPVRGVVVIRIAGDLDRFTAPRVARLVDNQLADIGSTRMPRLAHLIIDLAQVRRFGIGGLEVLRHARYTGGRTGVQLYVTGIADRAMMLPTRVADLIPQFRTFPTIDHALATLTEAIPTVEPGP